MWLQARQHAWEAGTSQVSAKTSFDPSHELKFEAAGGSTNSMWQEKRVPVMLMEQRVSPGKKLGHAPTVEDRLQFGRELIAVMAETVLE